MAPLAPLHHARATLHDTINTALQEHPASTLPSAQPPHVASAGRPLHPPVMQAHSFHLPALTIILLIATGGVSLSLSHSSPLPLLKGCHLLCPEPQEKAMRKPGFPHAAVPGQQESSLGWPLRSLGPGGGLSLV